MFKKSFKDIGKKYKYFYGPYDEKNKQQVNTMYMQQKLAKKEDFTQSPGGMAKKRVTLVGSSIMGGQDFTKQLSLHH